MFRAMLYTNILVQFIDLSALILLAARIFSIHHYLIAKASLIKIEMVYNQMTPKEPSTLIATYPISQTKMLFNKIT